MCGTWCFIVRQGPWFAKLWVVHVACVAIMAVWQPGLGRSHTSIRRAQDRLCGSYYDSHTCSSSLCNTRSAPKSGIQGCCIIYRMRCRRPDLHLAVLFLRDMCEENPGPPDSNPTSRLGSIVLTHHAHCDIPLRIKWDTHSFGTQRILAHTEHIPVSLLFQGFPCGIQ